MGSATIRATVTTTATCTTTSKNISNVDRIEVKNFTAGSVVCDYDVVFKLPAKGVDPASSEASDQASSSLSSLLGI